MGFKEKKEVRDKVLGEGVQPEVRAAFEELFAKMPLTSTTT